MKKEEAQYIWLVALAFVGVSACNSVVLEGAAGGGVAGLRVPVVEPSPAFTCANGTCTLDNTVEIMKGDYQYKWRPAVATGIIGRRQSGRDTSNLGLGVQLVAAPVRDNATRLGPAVTVHLGRGRNQFFLGSLFMPADALDLPDEGIRVPKGTDPNLFIRSGRTTKLNFFLGIILSGDLKTP